MSLRRDRFFSNITLCKQCIAQHGSLTFRGENKEKRIVGNWLRRQYERKNIPPDEMKLLEELRPYTKKQGRGNRDEHWQCVFDELVQYKDNYHTLVISKKDKEHRHLYSWTFLQRRLEREGRLCPKRRDALLNIGFRFASKPKIMPSHDERFTKKEINEWETMFQQLLLFRKKFGHCKVSFDDDYYRPLGRWVHRQRSAFVNGRLDSQRKERLNAIGFQWKVRDTVGINSNHIIEKMKDG